MGDLLPCPFCSADAPAHAEPVAWLDGFPPKPWAEEWFIALLKSGERVVLRALPDDWSYDFKTADETYYKADLIKAWMQFPDSEYVAHPPTDAAEIERLRADIAWLKRSIFGSANYDPSLPTGCFAEMAQTTEAARVGGLARAEKAEARVAELESALAPLPDAELALTIGRGEALAEWHGGAVAVVIRELIAALRSAPPVGARVTVQDDAAAFDRADWFWRTMDPDDCGDSPEEAINRAMVGQFCVCEIASSYHGPTRYGFIAPVLDPESDDEEFVHFATQQEAVDAAKARRAALLPAGEGE